MEKGNKSTDGHHESAAPIHTITPCIDRDYYKNFFLQKGISFAYLLDGERHPFQQFQEFQTPQPYKSIDLYAYRDYSLNIVNIGESNIAKA